MTHHRRYDLPAPARAQKQRQASPVKLLLVGVFVLVTALILVNAVRSSGDQDTAVDSTAATSQGGSSQDGSDSDGSGTPGPKPGDVQRDPGELGALPAGGPYTEKGSQKYRLAGKPGAKVGKGTEEDHVYTYVIEVEDSINAEQYGGDDAFAAMVEATLANPKSWIHQDKYSFEHVDGKKVKDPDFRFQLSSTETTHEICGNTYDMETSCFYPIGDRVMINEARWVRGAAPFEGDLGAYRQYVINHELGHGVGFASHEPCDEDGGLAPIMMQQTLSLSNSELYGINPEESYKNNDNTCRPNPWPFP